VESRQLFQTVHTAGSPWLSRSRLRCVDSFATTFFCVPGSNKLGLSWAVGFAGFNLEVTTSLPPNAIRQTVPGPYYLSNGTFGLSVPGTAAQQFFRLRKPLP
jgi:hypothetical protein